MLHKVHVDVTITASKVPGPARFEIREGQRAKTRVLALRLDY